MSKLKLFILLYASLFLTSTLNASEEQKKVFVTKYGEKLNYQLYSPKSSKALPLIIFMHGAGERGNDNKKQTVHGVPEFIAYSKKTKQPVLILSPQVTFNQQWVNVPWSATEHTTPKYPSLPMRLTIDLVKKMIAEGKVDKSRIYVTGLSMGGFGVWDLMQREPKLIAAGIPVCGGADIKSSQEVKDIPVWVHHGAKDSIVKPKRARDMVNALKSLGSSPKYTEYKKRGHFVWKQAYGNEEVLKWLFAQKKSTDLKPKKRVSRRYMGRS